MSIDHFTHRADPKPITVRVIPGLQQPAQFAVARAALGSVEQRRRIQAALRGGRKD